MKSVKHHTRYESTLQPNKNILNYLHSYLVKYYLAASNRIPLNPAQPYYDLDYYKPYKMAVFALFWSVCISRTHSSNRDALIGSSYKMLFWFYTYFVKLDLDLVRFSFGRLFLATSVCTEISLHNPKQNTDTILI